MVVGAGAKVLGNLNIGDRVRIGAGSVVLRDVPSDCTVVGIPGRVVYRSGVKIDPLDHNHLPDSEAKVIRMLLDRIEHLEKQIEDLQQSQASHPLVGAGHRGGTALKSDYHAEYQAVCTLQNREIYAFLDGSGI